METFLYLIRIPLVGKEAESNHFTVKATAEREVRQAVLSSG